MDIQAPGVLHLTNDDYITLGRNGPGSGGEAFPHDMGLTYGFRVGRRMQAEVGFDVLEPSNNPFYFNAKIGYAEGALSARAPALQLGLFNLAAARGANQSIVHLLSGKTLPNRQGRIHASLYLGNAGVLRSSSGGRRNTGFMLGYDRYLVPGKVMLAGDFASGKNAPGGGGVGLYYFFSPDIDLLVGPVWFNDKALNGATKFTAQIDVNFKF